MPKTSKNGTPAPALAPTPVSSEPPAEFAGIVISSDERMQLGELQAEALRCKVMLADADIQIASLEAARGELRQKVSDSSKAYVDAVVAAASAHGIDLNDKTVRWNFDTQRMTFTRQS